VSKQTAFATLLSCSESGWQNRLRLRKGEVTTDNPSVLEVMLRRRSIRRFTPRPVTAEQEEQLLKAAFSGPSSTNSRPWHFIVVRDPERRRSLAVLHDYTAMLEHAPLVIAVLGHPSSPWWIEDCSAATENILLEATELGLGGIWCGVRIPDGDEGQYYPILGIAEGSGWRVLSLVGIGYSAEHKRPRTQYEADKVSYETFGQTRGLRPRR
jgi:nitroreductase